MKVTDEKIRSKIIFHYLLKKTSEADPFADLFRDEIEELSESTKAIKIEIDQDILAEEVKKITENRPQKTPLKLIFLRDLRGIWMIFSDFLGIRNNG